MNIDRLDYYRFLDIQTVAENFMALYLELTQHLPAAEELVSFAVDRMGAVEYGDPEHYMYNYLLFLAQEMIKAQTFED